VIDFRRSSKSKSTSASGSWLTTSIRPRGSGVEAIVCSGVGRRAMATLETAGIRVLVARASRVDEVLESFRVGAVREISAQEACAGHHDRDGCHGRS
jgi:predicted Fe-Mo cluster-binding NifX family protein